MIARAPRPAAALAALLAALVLAAPASARERYCTKKQDTCLAAVQVGGQEYLGINTFTLRGTYRLCVTDPLSDRVCRSFTLKLRKAFPSGNAVFASHVRWSAHFPSAVAGDYVAEWRKGGKKLGLTIQFTVH